MTTTITYTEELDEGFVERLVAGKVRGADGTALPEELWNWLMREAERLDLARQQLARYLRQVDRNEEAPGHQKAKRRTPNIQRPTPN